jgi:hypothetical protein
MPTPSTHSQRSLHRRFRSGLGPCDYALKLGQEPPLGAHMVAPRRAYAHHGIYAGQGRVLQYGGGLRRGQVEEVSICRFSHGRQIWIRLAEPGWRDQPEVVHRARSRLGENRYHVLRNNCEHFCEWCVRGQHRSYQVEALVGRVGKGWLLFAESFARIFTQKRPGRNRAKPTSPGAQGYGTPTDRGLAVDRRNCHYRVSGAHATPPRVLLRASAGGSIFRPPAF